MFDGLRERLRTGLERLMSHDGLTEIERQAAHDERMRGIGALARIRKLEFYADQLNEAHGTYLMGSIVAREVHTDNPTSAAAARSVGRMLLDVTLDMAYADGISYGELMDVLQQRAEKEMGGSDSTVKTSD